MFQHKGLNGNVGMLLLYLADNMRSDLTVSVPRTRIAEDLNVNVRRVTERMQAAHEVGLLDTIVHGRPHVTAVYKAMFPSAEVRTGDPHRGAEIRTSNHGSRGADGGPPIRYSPTEVTSPNGNGFTSNAPRSSLDEAEEEEEEESWGRRQPAVKPVGNAVDRGTPRAQVLDAIQLTASEGGIYTEAGDGLIALLDEHYGDEVAGHVANYWTVPRKARDRYEAGVWLNTMLNTLRKEGLTA